MYFTCECKTTNQKYWNPFVNPIKIWTLSVDIFYMPWHSYDIVHATLDTGETVCTNAGSTESRNLIWW